MRCHRTLGLGEKGMSSEEGQSNCSADVSDARRFGICLVSIFVIWRTWRPRKARDCPRSEVSADGMGFRPHSAHVLPFIGPSSCNTPPLHMSPTTHAVSSMPRSSSARSPYIPLPLWMFRPFVDSTYVPILFYRSFYVRRQSNRTTDRLGEMRAASDLRSGTSVLVPNGAEVL